MKLRSEFQIGERTRSAPVWIIGPDVIESHEFTLDLAHRLADIAESHGLTLIFKASYEKANRTSHDSFRGPGLESGLETLAEVKKQTGLPVLSDVHTEEEARVAAEVLDVIQIPAFLSRQNALLETCAATGRIVNLKRGQFLSPWEIGPRVRVLEQAGAKDVWVTERGVSFGYNRLVNDFRVVPLAQQAGASIIFDATHSIQTPAGQGASSGGERPFIPVLARAAAAAGVDGFFFEVHPNPDEALCDGPNALPEDKLPQLLRQLLPLTQLVRELPEIELE